MPLSWNEIKHRAIAFSKEWKDETREEAEAKSFWDAFFLVFGVPRRTVASFEEPAFFPPRPGQAARAVDMKADWEHIFLSVRK